jgi:hypothetical protein
LILALTAQCLQFCSINFKLKKNGWWKGQEWS